jgi:hypothetical protein
LGQKEQQPWRSGVRQDAVIGAIARKGNVLARETREAVQRFISECVSDKVRLLATGEAGVYEGLKGYRRTTVHRESGRYAIGAVHTNTIEDFWSLFKRGIVGSFHRVSEKHMPLYVAEFTFRHNNRQNPDIFGTAIAGC